MKLNAPYFVAIAFRGGFRLFRIGLSGSDGLATRRRCGIIIDRCIEDRVGASTILLSCGIITPEFLLWPSLSGPISVEARIRRAGRLDNIKHSGLPFLLFHYLSSSFSSLVII